MFLMTKDIVISVALIQMIIVPLPTVYAQIFQNGQVFTNGLAILDAPAPHS
jgi:hypothetical protein